MVDYDPGASEVNQLNRIKLMISVAKANLAEELKAEQQHSEEGSTTEFHTESEVETTRA